MGRLSDWIGRSTSDTGAAAFRGGEQRSLENPAIPITQAALAQILGTGYRTAAGVTVNQDSALRLGAVFACVKAISETISTLPVDVLVPGPPGTKSRQVDAPRWLDSPNSETTRPEMIENQITSALLDGNSYTQIVRDNSDTVQELWTLNPQQVSERRDQLTQRLMYDVTLPNSSQVSLAGLVNSARGSVAFGDLLHMRAFRQPGAVRGLSVIEYCRQSIGKTIAAEQFGAAFFGNGANLGGVIEYPAEISQEAAKILLSTWNTEHRGLAHAGEPGVLTNGAHWAPISIPPEQAQFIATLENGVTDVARMFRMPPHKIGDLSRATFSNIEHQAIEWVVDCLMPWIVRWEHAISRLLPMGQVAKVNVNGLLRGDMKTRFEAYTIGRNGGWLSANDVRDLEDENPLPSKVGDAYLMPMNMAEAGGDESSKGLYDRAFAALKLVQAGYDPDAVLAACKLPPMEHVETGASLPLPPTATPEDEGDDPESDLGSLDALGNALVSNGNAAMTSSNGKGT